MLVNLDRNQIYIQCPRCSFFARPFLRQVRHRETIICGGCKSNLKLEDHLGTYRKGERELQKAFDELAETLEDITITINL